MKKILAGILASASLLAMTVSASATSNKTVTAAGELEYDVSVTAPKVVLNLIMPAKMSAALNPYGADIKMVEEVKADADAGIDAVAEVTTTAGIASPAYAITNMSTDYGIVIDATATTTVTAAKGDTWVVKTATPTAGTKSAQMALITADTAEDLRDLAEVAKLEDETSGVLLLDSTKTVKAKKFMSLGGATKDETDPEDVKITGVTSYLGFAGKLAESTETKDVEWTEDDAINVALVLKVVAGPKGAGGNGGSSTVTAANALTAVSITSDEVTWSDNTTFAVGTTSYTLTGVANKDALTFAATAKTGFSVTYAATGAGGDNSTDGTIECKTGSNKMVITVTNDNDSSDTATYTYNITV